MRFIAFPIIGCIIGLFAGAMLGAGENRYKNKTERELTGGFTINAFGILGGIAGFLGGIWLANVLNEDAKKSKQAEAERLRMIDEHVERTRLEDAAKSSLGLNREQTQEFKEGRYWVFETRWADFRTHADNLLRTGKNKDGILTSIWNGVEYMNHNQTSASGHITGASHARAKKQLFCFLTDEWIQETKASSS